MPEEFNIESACMSYFNASYDKAQLRLDMNYDVWPDDPEEDDDWPEDDEEEPENDEQENNAL